MTDTLFYTLVAVGSFNCAMMAKVIIFSMMYGHRLSFIKEWMALRILRKNEMNEDINSFHYLVSFQNEMTHEQLILNTEEIYDKIAHLSKWMGLFSCEYCLSIVLAICVSIGFIGYFQLGFFASIAIVSSMIAVDFFILLVLNKFLG